MNTTSGGGHDNNNDDTTLRFRRPLLTEDERRCMSSGLVASIAPKATARVLRQLDDDGEALLGSAARRTGSSRGPFTVFRANFHARERARRSSPSVVVAVEESAVPPNLESSLPASSLAGPNTIDKEDEVVPYEVMGNIDPDGQAQQQEQQEQPPSWNLPAWSHNMILDLMAEYDGQGPATIQTSSSEGNDPAGSPPNMNYNLGTSTLPQRSTDLLFDSIFRQSPPAEDVDVEQPRDSELAHTSSSRLAPNLLQRESWEAAPAGLEFELPPIYEHNNDLAVSQPLSFPPIAMPTFMNAHQNPLLMQAIPLLKHYGTTVIASMTPFRHTNTPWHVMFLAQLKTCLATFTLHEALDDAGLTTFYGSLAASALSLGLMTQSPVWLAHVHTYQHQASAHARAVLARAPYADMAPGAYRDALMALLTMAQVSIFLGRRDQAEGYLLETERLVRVRGLPARRKSRKIRLLHHCYVYMRLFHESTFLAGGGDESAHRQQVRRAVEGSSGGSASSADNLSFRLLQWDDLQREMNNMKGQIEGENDLHIAKPGIFPPTMYPEIFGLPEIFMCLLSQVIRLGNEKDVAQKQEQRQQQQQQRRDMGDANSGESQADSSLPTTASLGDFTRRAKAIEHGIEQLQEQTRPAFFSVQQQQQQPSQRSEANSNNNNNNNNDPLVLPSLLEGMQTALSIYFYRRIYDVNSSLLQPKVLAVRDWLYAYDQANPDFLYGSFGLVWPAFIAACEADGRQVRESFRQWFRGAAGRSGLACFTENLGVVEKVWEMRSRSAAGGKMDAGQGVDVTWLDVVRGMCGQAAPSINTAQMLFMGV